MDTLNQPSSNQSATEQPQTFNPKPSSHGKALLITFAFCILFFVSLIALLLASRTKPSSQPPSSPIPPTTSQPSPTIDQTANWKTYTNSDYGFRIKYPQSLNTRSPENAPGLFILSISEKEEWIQIGTEGPAEPYDLNKTINSDLQRSGNPIRTEFQNRPAVSYRPAMKPEPPNLPGVPYKALIIYLENKKSEIEIEYFGGGDNEALFDQILSTFKFTNQ